MRSQSIGGVVGNEPAKQGVPWVLLATGTIVPNVTTDSVRNDCSVRLDDYLSALRFWAAITDLPIVFCENSGYDLAPFSDLMPDRGSPIELISFISPPIPVEKGKGYGDVSIVKYAIENSRLIGPDTIVVKITGRLKVLNFPRLLDRLRRLEFDMCVDLLASMDYADCRLFASKQRFLTDYLFPEAERIDESTYRSDSEGRRGPIMNLERVLAFATLRAVADGLNYELLPIDPQFDGFSGSYNIRYSNKRFPIRQLTKGLRHVTQSLEWIGYPAPRSPHSGHHVS